MQRMLWHVLMGMGLGGGAALSLALAQPMPVAPSGREPLPPTTLSQAGTNGLPKLPGSAAVPTAPVAKVSSESVVPNPNGLPAVPSPQPAVRQEAGIVAPPKSDQKTYSYGKSSLSVLFLPTQIDRMRAGMKAYEDAHAPGNVVFSKVEPEKPVTVEEKVKEPDNYPVFFLSSVVYHDPSDWSLWISGHKITSRKNDTDVNVLAVSREGATFSWKPSYADVIARRVEEKKIAAPDAVKNKLAVHQLVTQDPQTQAITFTLKQNQTFAVAYFRVFEGFMDSAALPPLSANAVSENGSIAIDPLAPSDPTGMPSPPEPGLPPSPVPPSVPVQTVTP